MSGELIYLSERKLNDVAIDLGVETTHVTSQLSMEGSAAVRVPLKVVDMSARITKRVERANEPRTESTRAHLLLDGVEKTLDRRGIPDLDTGAANIPEAGWFRFHRHLTFGIGAADDDRAVRAFVFVDSAIQTDGGVLPGLLMHGAPVHVRDHYRPDDIDTRPGARSGSGSSELFTWATEMSARLDTSSDDLSPEMIAAFAERPADLERQARVIYNLFADVYSPIRPAQLVNRAPCEGIAKAICSAPSDDGSTIMIATPLYVRERPLPVSVDPPTPMRQTGFFGRTFRRGAP